MPLDVRETFLNHPEQRQLEIRRHAAEARRNLKIHFDSGSRGEALHVMTNRVLKSGFIQHRWVQKVGKCADFADALVRQSLTMGSELAQLSAGRRNGSMELTQGSCQSDEVLAGGIVQVPGDAAPLLVLQTQELTGQATELLLGSHSFGDVTASARNTNRLSF